MWPIWHKAVAVNERRARITPASIFEQPFFYLPNTSESVIHTIWDCIQGPRDGSRSSCTSCAGEDHQVC